MRPGTKIWLLFIMLLVTTGRAGAQLSKNDTIRTGAVMENGTLYPALLLPEFTRVAFFMDPEMRLKRQKLRNDVYVVYPYAIASAAIFKDVNAKLETMDGRRDRKQYLRSIDKTLDQTFKEPLKNLSIDQGHVLIKLINRQTGQNCYSIIKELKGGFSAVVWQSVGVVFNNNLAREYDPEDRDRDLESVVQELEASNLYRYQLSQQDAIVRKVLKPAPAQ